MMPPPSNAWLCGFARVHERPPQRLWRLYFDKAIRRVQVVFAAFIDHTDVTLFSRVWVRQHAVGLVQFRRGRVAAIVNAHLERTVT